MPNKNESLPSPTTLPDQEDFCQQVALFSEALQNPESAISLLELKLVQLAQSSGYESLQEMEQALDVDNRLDPDLAQEAKLGINPDDKIFLHTAKDKYVFPDENRRILISYNYQSRLFWIRSSDGKLKVIRTDYPHLDHFSICISDEKVITSKVTSRVLKIGSGRDGRMQNSKISIEKSAEIFVNSFNIHQKNQPLGVKIKKLLSKFP